VHPWRSASRPRLSRSTPGPATVPSVTGLAAMAGRIVVSGATGNTGQLVAKALAARGLPVVAMARTEANRGRLRDMGLEAVHGDFDEPLSLARALDGAQKAYLVCTPDEHLVRRETAFVHAAERA